MENSNIKENNGIYTITLNPKIYSLDVIYGAAYSLTEKAYINLDEDENGKVLVNIKPKENNNGEEIANEFNNELINYSEYKSNFENNKEIRNMILQRAIITSDDNYFKEENENIEEINDDEDENLEELENTTIPWETENDDTNN